MTPQEKQAAIERLFEFTEKSIDLKLQILSMRKASAVIKKSAEECATAQQELEAKLKSKIK
jgi:hypothetical protein